MTMTVIAESCRESLDRIFPPSVTSNVPAQAGEKSTTSHENVDLPIEKAHDTIFVKPFRRLQFTASGF